MKILFACRQFEGAAGGVERQAIAMMNELMARGHEIHLLTWDREGAKAFYPMDPAICWHQLAMGDPKKKAGLGLRLARAQRVRAVVKASGAAVVLAFQQGTFLSMRLYTLGLGVPVIAAERESPYRYDFIREGRHRDFIFQGFRLAVRVTIQCESYRESYPAYLRDKIVTIPNPVFPAEKFAAPAGTESGRKTLLCVGRLSFAKNQSVLLRAFAQIAAVCPDWDVVLAGEGEDREKLEDESRRLGLAGRVSFLGAVKDVTVLYETAHLFCLPSRWEGFPNALAEALAHGLPAVGFAGCGGVRDLIIDDENGLLADGMDDAESLAETLKRLMCDDARRTVMGEAAVQSVKPYAPSLVYNRWEALLTEVGRE